MIIYPLLGAVRVLSVSSTATIGILAATQLGLIVPDVDPGKLVTAAATLTALTGAFLILAGVLRLLFVANLISSSVLTGFNAGIGLVIVKVLSYGRSGERSRTRNMSAVLILCYKSSQPTGLDRSHGISRKPASP
jgi:H+/Cl- antiporter ClcA